MYPTLLFDMDGTLIDSADGVFQSLRYAMESVGGPELPRGAVRHFLGTPIERVLQTRFGCDAQTALLVRERFLNHYRDHGLYATVPVPGMVELTARLKTAGFRLAIATCKPWAYCGPTLAQCGFLDCFEAVSGSYHNGVGIHLFGTVKHLPGFPVCHIGHRTGVDHIDICQIMKRYDLISVLFQQFLHRFCFISIYLTTQVV